MKWYRTWRKKREAKKLLKALMGIEFTDEQIAELNTMVYDNYVDSMAQLQTLEMGTREYVDCLYKCYCLRTTMENDERMKKGQRMDYWPNAEDFYETFGMKP